MHSEIWEAGIIDYTVNRLPLQGASRYFQRYRLLFQPPPDTNLIAQLGELFVVRDPENRINLEWTYYNIPPPPPRRDVLTALLLERN